jgi:hypothetical protein
MIFLILFLILPCTAHAYLDPGTGTVLINIVLAGAAAIAYSLKGLFLRIFKKGHRLEVQKRKNIEIALFSEGKQYWNSYEPIISNLLAQKTPFRYYTLDIEDPGLEIEDDLMDSRFLGHGSIAKYRILAIDVKYLITTTPNIGSVGYIRRPAKVETLAHFFHSISDISMYRKGSLDHYDEVFLAGEFQKESIRLIENTRGLKHKKLTVLGLPYLDTLAGQKPTGLKENKLRTILIGSSWGDKGLLRYCGTDFIRSIAAENYHIIIRPHPQSYLSERKFIQKCMNELKGLKNIEWDATINPTESMSKADVLISDTSSLRFDFSFIYEKPVISVNIPSSAMPGFERDDLVSIWSDTVGKRIGTVIEKTQLKDIVEIIKITYSHNSSRMLQEFREETISNYKNAGAVFAKYLANLAEDKTDA